MQQLGATEDLTSVEWRDMNWLERFGGFQNQQMVLDYFALSPFWDRQCNNQVLAMQTQYNDLRQPYEATLEALRKMTGIEFAVVHEQPPVYIIQKRYRRGTAIDDVNPIAIYYITGANVYQSPTIYSIIANRLLTSLFHVNSAFKETQNMMEFHPSKGYSWKTMPDSNKTSKKSIASSSVDKSSGSGSSTPAAGSNSTSGSVVNTNKGVLRAQETQMFRHWMERAIESSSNKVIKNRRAIESPETDETVKSTRPAMLDLSLQQQSTRGGDDLNAKRPRKKTDEGGSSSRKKKAASTK